jgi:hypothetical protein
MAYVTASTEDLPSGRGISFSGTLKAVLAALLLASGATMWLSPPFGPGASVPPPASLEVSNSDTPSLFDSRFSPSAVGQSFSTEFRAAPLLQFLRAEAEEKFQEAKRRLAQEMRTQLQQAAVEPTTIASLGTESTPSPSPSTAGAVPIPRPRPAEAIEPPSETRTAQTENRTLLQKLSDLFPARIRLASLGPDGGLIGEGPDLAALGYDNVTAVYDISARAVYMPDGTRLEAHSGFGHLMDDPEHVNERDVGATPPSAYDLKLREQLFHGVQALRMVPQDGSDTLGRSGLLTHGYMLGPNGDSNGCVSIRDYDRFLKAFKNGEVKRLVVVRSINDSASASRRSTSQS